MNIENRENSSHPTKEAISTGKFGKKTSSSEKGDGDRTKSTKVIIFPFVYFYSYNLNIMPFEQHFVSQLLLINEISIASCIRD